MLSSFLPDDVAFCMDTAEMTTDTAAHRDFVEHSYHKIDNLHNCCFLRRLPSVQRTGKLGGINTIIQLNSIRFDSN